MKTFNVQKRVSTEKTTEIYDQLSFDTLEEATSKFNDLLSQQETYAGEYNDGQFSEYYNEVLEIESFDTETDDFETIEEVVVYQEGLTDKNNYKGEYANNYWAIASHNGTELIYNFYDNGFDLNLKYENVKASDLKQWYNH